MRIESIVKTVVATLTLSPAYGFVSTAHAQQEAMTELEIIVIEDAATKVTHTTAGPVRGYRALTASSSTKTDTPIERIPQNIQVIPKKLLDDQIASSVSEAVKNVSNVQPQDSRIIGNVEQVPMKIRGFGAERWTDGYPGNLFAAGDREGLVNVERIEVLKGPNSIVYGGGAGAPVGGVINVISKLPTEKPGYEIGVTAGSHGYWNLYFDINQPLSNDGTVLFRMTGEYGGADSFIDVLESKRYNINPTLTLTNKDTTSLTVQAFVSSHKQQAYPGVPVFGTILGNVRFNDRLYFGDPGIESSYARQYGVTTTFDHEFNEVWSTNIRARWSQSEINQLAQASLMDATGTGGFPPFPPSIFDVNNMEHFDKQREFSINPTVQAKFALGRSENILLLGADYAHITDKGFMTMGLMPGLVDLQNPIFPRYSRPVVGVDGMAFFDFDVSYETKGLYGQLQSSIHDRVHLLLGGRLGSLDVTYNELSSGLPVTHRTEETKFLPRAGIVLDLVEGLSLYANYSEGMKWVPFSTFVSKPEPELSKSSEAGLKFSISSFTGTLSVFQIDRENVPYQISPGIGGLSTQRSRGFEADTIYQPNENWSILASYGYTNAVFSSPTPGVPVGTRVPMVPEHSGRLWVNYRFGPDVMPGWSIGAGVYAASSQTVNALFDWRTDGYFTVDAKIGYENARIRAFLSVKNLTGEHYYTPYTWFGGQVAPGAPRAVYGQISYKF